MVCGDAALLGAVGRRRSLPTLLRLMFLSRVPWKPYREGYWGSAFSLALGFLSSAIEGSSFADGVFWAHFGCAR